MKDLVKLMFLVIIIGSCSKDCYDIERSNLVCNDHCEHDEFHATCLVNGECFNSLRTVGNLEKGRISFIIINSEQNQYGAVHIRLRKNKISSDTLYFKGSVPFLNGENNSDIFFSYSEDDQLLGSFDLHSGGGTKEDYMIIDYVNEDTTEIAGRFQVAFTKRSVGLPIDIPPSMAITCGTFKVKIED